MKITLLVMGKTDEPYLREGIEIYVNRLRHYSKFELIEHQFAGKMKGGNSDVVREKEAVIQIKYIEKSDVTVLLEESGQTLSSVEFAGFIQQQMNRSVKRLLFISGGPWGFDKEVYRRASMKLSLSAMTFSHQMVRLIFVEQLYRAFSIIRNDPYHNS
ncbi:MAG TPA: 23S rRNA (pseudouridine(1915)-N(3))-methyltransferase RlmH [Bacteroidales bacterium]|nr:23S rRNA (pseudouridine(1915)-N(3))-methyltransferase RlmH [Bacteroidales bacterium]